MVDFSSVSMGGSSNKLNCHIKKKVTNVQSNKIFHRIKVKLTKNTLEVRIIKFKIEGKKGRKEKIIIFPLSPPPRAYNIPAESDSKAVVNMKLQNNNIQVMNKFKIPGFFLCVYHSSFARELYNFHFSSSNNNIIHSREHSRVKRQKEKKNQVLLL